MENPEIVPKPEQHKKEIRVIIDGVMETFSSREEAMKALQEMREEQP